MNRNPLHRKDYEVGDEVILVDPYENRYWVRDNDDPYDRAPADLWAPGVINAPPTVADSIGKSYYFVVYDGLDERNANVKLTPHAGGLTTDRLGYGDWFWIASDHVMPIEQTITDEDVAEAIASVRESALRKT